MKQLGQRILLFFSLISLIYPPAYATEVNTSYSLMGEKRLSGSLGSEFVSGAQPGSVLMRVNLWGGVRRPGIHHVPTNTNLITLLSYAGGPNRDAILDDVTIKRFDGKSQKKIEIDVEEIIKGSSHYNVKLEPNDIVVIPEKSPLIGRDTILIVGLIATISSIILTAVIIDKNQDN